MPRGGLGLLVVVCAACRCGGGPLDGASSEVALLPSAVDFGNTYLQAQAAATLTAANTGASGAVLTLTLEVDAGSGLSLPGGETVALGSGASAPVVLAYAPAAPGPLNVVLRATWADGETAIAISGQALSWPACAPTGPCVTAAFDPTSGVCVQTPVADGQACASTDVCLIDATCAGGQCLGQLDPCDDGDACTADFCVEGIGCQHRDGGQQCQGADLCQVYGCDPASGCVSSPASDGTPCAAVDSCQTNTACVGGQCSGTTAPDGTPCRLWWAPCVDDAICTEGTCESLTADGYSFGQTLWVADAGYYLNATLPVDDAGTTFAYRQVDVAVGATELAIDQIAAIDACGRDVWVFDAGVLQGGSQSPGPIGPPFEMLDGDLLLCGDNWGDRSAFDRSSGANLWGVSDAIGLSGGPYGEPYYGAPAYSNQGLLAVAGTGQTTAAVTALTSGSALQWTELLSGPDSLGYFQGGTFADSAGDILFNLSYNETVLDWPDWPDWPDAGGLSLTGALDPGGNLRFANWGPGGNGPTALRQYFQILAVGDDHILGYTGGSGLGTPAVVAWSLSGQTLYQVPLSAGVFYGIGIGASIDDAGVGYVPLQSYDADAGMSGGVAALAANGTVLWTTTLPGQTYPVSSPVLDDQGDIILATESVTDDINAYIGEEWLALIDRANGTVLAQVDEGPNLTGVPGYSGLTLSGAGTVLRVGSGGQLTAYFVGKRRLDPAAPWPRAGGDNRNRNAPQR